MVHDGIAYDTKSDGSAALRCVPSESLAASIPGASIEIMEGCGHVMFYEQPADFNRRVIRFLAAGRDGPPQTTEPASQDREAVA